MVDSPAEDDLNPHTLPMLDVLPAKVVRMLRRHYYAGVKEAEVRFKYHAADEDSVTGALGERLIEPEIFIGTEGQVFRWSTFYHKLRGRGPNAPERKIGADGIFQLEVLDRRQRFILRKGLLFQAKIDWGGRDGRLLDQAQDLVAQSRSAIVIDYSSNGYKAIAAMDVISANGDRTQTRPGADKPLAEVLGDEFVGCMRGDRGMYWEPQREKLVVDGTRFTDFVPADLVATRIQRLQ
jgi:hypothetical protein